MNDAVAERDEVLAQLRLVRSGLEAKRVLLCVSEERQVKDLLGLLACVPGCTVQEGGSSPVVTFRELSLRFQIAFDKNDVITQLRHGYFNLVIIDLRSMSGRDEELEPGLLRVRRLIASLDRGSDIEARYGFHRIKVLVSANDDDRADAIIADLAKTGVARIMRDRTPRPLLGSAPDPRGIAFATLLLEEARGRMIDRRTGRNALCASGGGITGIYFEMGVLKCLDDCIGPHGVSGFDDYYGISAGAIVTSVLVNGYSVDEAMAAILGIDVGRLGRVDLSLVHLHHVNFRDIRARFGRAGRDITRTVWNILRGQAQLNTESLLLQYADLFGAPLQGSEFERKLRRVFSRLGTTNDFRRLPKRLHIGATDQDLKSHVIFGNAGWDDVPISLAVQASFSINPAFCATKINGRYYEDGQVTRTSNFQDAIAQGAGLIFIVDPFAPYVSKEPGYAQKKGLFYNVDQDIRTLSYTRFERARADSLRKHPEVSSYTFLPQNRLRQLMSTNPMDHRPFLPIWKGAYLSTLQRVHALEYRMAGDLAVHAMALDTRKADVVADQLRSVDVPTFADFFPDRRIEIRMEPLALEGPGARPALVDDVPVGEPAYELAAAL